MKTISTFICVTIMCLISNAQCKKDTIDYLFNLSEDYFTTMYVNKNFQKAYIMWDKKTLIKLREIYKSDKTIISDSLLLVKIERDYNEYFKTVSRFRFGMFGCHQSNNNQDPLEIMLSFYYNDSVNKKKKNKSTALFFSPVVGSKNWVLEDLIVFEIAKKYSN
jgi:hypothetical protein